MSRSDRIQRDMQRAARRAKRLAERAEQRAGRREDRARKAAYRAEELADRVARRAKRRSQELERNIEDVVDQVADRWSRKAEQWMESLDGDHNGHRRRRRASAGRMRQPTDQADEDLSAQAAGDADARQRAAGDAGPEMSRSERKYRRRQRRAARSSRRTARRQMRYRAGLYRDPDRAKICGVCAGFADYFGIEAWQMRLGAILGLVFIPQLTFCGYFVAYFLMDKKPYYRRATDRFDRAERQWQSSETDEEEDLYGVNEDKHQGNESHRKPRMSNGLALRTAKSKFTELEDRVRSMESHVTSSKFELQRELKKLSGEN
ncbi:MAG: PspC domain-containing protein [Pseudomonadales bacterium]|nr:PspC domain-containing protein [Pseudomonadales bacterium]